MLKSTIWLRMIAILVIFLAIQPALLQAQEEETGVETIVEEEQHSSVAKETTIVEEEKTTETITQKVMQGIKHVVIYLLFFVLGFVVCFYPCISLLFYVLLRCGHKAKRAAHISWGWVSFLAFILANILFCWLFKIKVSLFPPFIVVMFCLGVVFLFILLFYSLFVKEK